MKLLFLLSLFAITVIAENWSFKPIIYSRGGITTNLSLSKKATGTDVFNLGPWGDQTNAISNNLTEISLEANYGKNLKYTYGIDVDKNIRFYDQTSASPTKSLNERLNFLEFYNNKFSLWFGSRAFRGDGDYLLMNYPLDEHNLLGGGIKFNNINSLNIEFALGIKENSESTSDNINIIINKVELPLKKGKLKSNIELHKINNSSADNTFSYIIGGQYQRWGDTLFSGSMYNIFVLNYSHGNIYSGIMRSIFNSSDKDNPASKILVKWGGDIKAKNYGIYYTFQFQKHMGKASSQSWSFLDSNLRPVYSLSPNITTGIDFCSRTVLDQTNIQDSENWIYNNSIRTSIMLAYNPKNKIFDSASARIFIGRIISEKERTYFDNEGPSKSENFIRFSYELSI